MAFLGLVFLISAGTCNGRRPPTGAAESPEFELFDTTDVWQRQNPSALVYFDESGTHHQGLSVNLKKSESGYLLAVGGDGGGGRVYLSTSSDLTNWNALQQFNVGSGSALSLANFATGLVVSQPGSLWSYVSGSGQMVTDSSGTWPILFSGDTASCGLSVAIDSGRTIITGCDGMALIYARPSVGDTSYQVKQTLNASPYNGGSFGYSVAISVDGNTIAVTRPSGTGGVYVFYRADPTDAGSWAQQGNQLVGDSASPSINEDAVALSSTGSVLVYGASDNTNFVGAAWVFSRQDDLSWIAASPILEDSGSRFGTRVAISPDGTLIAVAAPPDAQGHVSTYRADGGVLEQVIFGTGSFKFGSALAMYSSGTSQYLLIGEPERNSNSGGIWIYKYVPTTKPPTVKPSTTKPPTHTPAPTTKTPAPTTKPVTPRFISYTNPGESITKGTISATTNVTLHFTNTITPVFTAPKLLTGNPYRSGPATANVKLTSIQAKATVSLDIIPGLVNPFLIYCAQWPEGIYHFTPKSWTILSQGSQVSKAFTDAQNRKSLNVTNQFSGIISFPVGVKQVTWIGNPKVKTTKLSFILAKSR